MKSLLTLTAALEALTGLGLLAVPAFIVSILLGAELGTPASFVVARVAGTALLTIGLACWAGRNEPHSRAAAGIVFAMLSYNATIVALLVHARFGWGMSGIGLWPGVGLHVALAVWCVACRRSTSHPLGQLTREMTKDE